MTSKGILSTENLRNLQVPSRSENAFYPRKISEDYVFFLLQRILKGFLFQENLRRYFSHKRTQRILRVSQKAHYPLKIFIYALSKEDHKRDFLNRIAAITRKH